MSTETWLAVIALATIVTTAIQCIEMFMILRSNRRTNEILENPAPVIVGLMDALKEDKEFAQEFGNFIAWGGSAALAGVRQNMETAGIKPPKIKSLGDFLGFLVQMPQIQAAIEKKMVGAVEGAAAEVVDKKVGAAMVEWGL